jgi:ribose 5-phosphate isomerase B
MKIALGSDHGGFTLKQSLIPFLQARDIQVADAGTVNSEESVDYPDFAERVALLVSHGEVDAGILVCGTGIGISIAANKVPGIRAALVTDAFMARMSKEHNNANILVLGGRVLDEEKAAELVAAWLDAAFEGGRHQGRLDKITEIENKYS